MRDFVYAGAICMAVLVFFVIGYIAGANTTPDPDSVAIWPDSITIWPRHENVWIDGWANVCMNLAGLPDEGWTFTAPLELHNTLRLGVSASLSIDSTLSQDTCFEIPAGETLEFTRAVAGNWLLIRHHEMESAHATP